MTNPLDHINQLSAWLADSDIGLLELRGPTGAVRLLNSGSSVHIHTADGPESRPRHAPTIAVRASSPGVFLDRHPLHERAIVSIGNEVRAGELIGFLQVGPLLMPVLAPQAGTMTEVFVERAKIVGYGEPLFELQVTESEMTP
jgi:acetyl-CoA carboxylase biotin carboxyl carrier protein